MTLHTAPSNHLVEIELGSTKPYQNPFFDVILDVTFTEPSGRQLTVPAFWAGGNRWVVRYASAALGVHRYTTQCNNLDDTGLHNFQGSITVTPYEGNNPLLRRGAPQVAVDQRHFCHADGTPFFWLGDTWWLGLTKRLGWPEAFQALAKDRADKGFTVVQIVAGLYPDMAAFDPRGESLAGFAWAADFTTINPAFFDEADARIFHLVEMGLCPCILGCWGYYLSVLGTDKMKHHWRYILARWAALPVVFVAAGEQIMPWYLSEQKAADSAWLKQEWSEVVRSMREINGFKRLITAHPQSQGARGCVDNPALVDFDMQQTGHGQATAQQAAQATAGWQAEPAMPVLSGESRYEALEIEPEVTTADARQAFWAHLLNSGCAGHTYGANGVWQVNRENDPFGSSPNGHNWGVTPWRQAMQLPGSSQLARAKALLITLPWHRLAPSPPEPDGLLRHLTTRGAKTQQPVAAAATEAGDLAVFYVLDAHKRMSVEAKRFSGPLEAFWFDPVSGQITNIDNVKPSIIGQMAFEPPGPNSGGDQDWVLVVQRRG